jgi:hypothetical protein
MFSSLGLNWFILNNILILHIIQSLLQTYTEVDTDRHINMTH